jgi:hypothetical protein
MRIFSSEDCSPPRKTAHSSSDNGSRIKKAPAFITWAADLRRLLGLISNDENQNRFFALLCEEFQMDLQRHREGGREVS